MRSGNVTMPCALQAKVAALLVSQQLVPSVVCAYSPANVLHAQEAPSELQEPPPPHTVAWMGSFAQVGPPAHSATDKDLSSLMRWEQLVCAPSLVYPSLHVHIAIFCSVPKSR